MPELASPMQAEAAEAVIRPFNIVRSELALECQKQKRTGRPDPAKIEEKQQELKASKMAEWIEHRLAEAPPLSPDQVAELMTILSSAPTTWLDATGLLDAGSDGVDL